jgi:hypothetical protein
MAGAPDDGARRADDQLSSNLPAMAAGIINWVVDAL